MRCHSIVATCKSAVSIGDPIYKLAEGWSCERCAYPPSRPTASQLPERDWTVAAYRVCPPAPGIPCTAPSPSRSIPTSAEMRD